MATGNWTKKVIGGALALTMAAAPGGIMGTASKAEAAENVTSSSSSSYESLFAANRVIDVKVTIGDEDWKSVLASPLDKDYKKVTVDVDGHVLSNVGFSTKGNLTLKSVASMTDSDRYSFRLKFDKYDKKQTLLGLDKLALNNNYSDPSYMREYLHYAALRAVGLDAPLITYVNLYINGELYGFYTGIEEVDDSYLARNFGSDYNSGVLYDSDDKSYLQYKEGSDYDSLTYETGTKDDKASLKKFIKVLNDMPAGEKGDIESVLDVDSALKYIAANAVLGSYDSYNGDKGHNYLLYGNAAGKFTVVPWDYNMSFNGYSGGGGAGGAPGGAGGAPGGAAGATAATDKTATDQAATDPSAKAAASTASESSASTVSAASASSVAASSVTNKDAVTASVDNPTLGIDIKEVPMINNLLQVPEYKQRYLGYVKQLTTWMTGIQSNITTLADWIRPYVQADPTKFYTMEQFNSNVTYSATGDAGSMQGGGMGGTPPAGTPPTGTPLTGTPPTGTPTGTPPTGTPPTGTPPTGNPGEGGAPGQGMGTMAAGSIMTFAMNRLVNLEQQLGMEVTKLPETSTTPPTDSSSSGGTSGGSSGGSTGSSGQTGGIQVLLNGTAVSFADQSPVLIKGRVLVPMRSLFSALGASITWDSKIKTVTAVADGTTIKLTAGSSKAYVNGKAVTLDVPASLIGQRMLVPVRFISETLKLNVNWNNSNSTVSLTTKLSKSA